MRIPRSLQDSAVVRRRSLIRPSRRSFLIAGAGLIASPAIVRAGSMSLLGVGGGASGAAFAPQGVFFDTSTWSKRTGAFTAIAASKVGTISFWYLNVSGQDASARSPISSGFGTGGSVSWTKASDGTMLMILQNSAASSLLTVKTTATFNFANGWRHYLASWNLATPTFSIYVNDVSSAGTPSVGPTNDTIDWVGGTGIQWFNFLDIGSGVGNGNIADLWMDPTTFLDLTVTANRRKFIDGSGNAVALGSTGQLPTGSTPILFQTGNVSFSNFLTNQGTGGNLTLQAGALVASSSNPP